MIYTEEQAKAEAAELARVRHTDPTFFHYRLKAIESRGRELKQQQSSIRREIDGLLVLSRELARLTQEAYQ